jgi:adenosylhomocysteine nucleosidase
VTQILILTAVELEARELARRLGLPPLRTLSFPAFGRGSVRLAPIGLRGAQCDSRWGPLLVGLGAPLVVSAGVCGALDPRLRPGDLVIPEQVIDEAGVACPLAATHHRAAVGVAGATAWTGPLVTTREVVGTPETKASLFARSGAVAVDMESGIIAARAAQSGYPALVVRAVSDDAGQCVPWELTRLVTPEGRVRFAGALALGVTRPAMLPGAFELRQRARQALRAVARTLAAMID